MSFQTRCASVARPPRQRIEQSLKEHHYLIVPMPLLNALNREKLSPVAKDLYLRYLQDAMCRSQPDAPRFDSLISTDLAARLLGVTPSAIRKANRVLESAGLIKRLQRSDKNGRTLPSATQVHLPAAFEEECENASIRQPSSTKRADTEPQTEQSSPLVEPSPAPTEHRPLMNAAAKELKKDIQTTERYIQKCKKQLKEAVLQKDRDQQMKWLSRLNQAESSLLALRLVSDDGSKYVRSPPHSASSPRTASSCSPPTGQTRHPSRRLGKSQLARLWERLRTLRGLSNPRETYQEVVFQVTQGVYADMAITKAVNICLKLVRLNKWRRPAGYQPIDAMG